MSCSVGRERRCRASWLEEQVSQDSRLESGRKHGILHITYVTYKLRMELPEQL